MEWWGPVVTVVGTLFGVGIGLIVNNRNEHRNWLRNQRLELYVEFSQIMSLNRKAPTDLQIILEMGEEVIAMLPRLRLLASPRVYKRVLQIDFMLALTLDDETDMPMSAHEEHAATHSKVIRKQLHSALAAMTEDLQLPPRPIVRKPQRRPHAR